MTENNFTIHESNENDNATSNIIGITNGSYLVDVYDVVNGNVGQFPAVIEYHVHVTNNIKRSIPMTPSTTLSHMTVEISSSSSSSLFSSSSSSSTMYTPTVSTIDQMTNRTDMSNKTIIPGFVGGSLLLMSLIVMFVVTASILFHKKCTLKKCIDKEHQKMNT